MRAEHLERRPASRPWQRASRVIPIRRRSKRWGVWIGFALATSLIVSGFPAREDHAYAADEFDELRAKWHEMVTGGAGLPQSDPDIIARTDDIEAAASTHWNSMDTSPTRTRLWSNLGGSGSDVKLTYRRLKEMALAYAVEGSTLQGDPQLRNDIVSAMDWMYVNFYNENTPDVGNWWDWDIGTPLELNDIVVMMYDEFTATQRTNYMAGIERFSPSVDGTGANRVWKAAVVGVRGIIVKDGAKVSAARDGLSDVFAYASSGDGFYRDGSFIQHTSNPYTGGYGKNLLSDVANLMFVLDESTWEVVDPRKQVVMRWVYDSFEPLMYEGAMADMVRGREISRFSFQDHVTGHHLMQSLIRVSQFAPLADARAIRSMVKRWITEDTYQNFYDLASINMIVLAKAIMSDSTTSARGALVRNAQFPQMDRVMHLRPEFGFGISMHSTRISNYESINAEHKRGWHTGDGMAYLYNEDLGQFSGDFWPTVNSYRLPGTTVLKDSTVTQGRGGSDAVGGATLGEYGVAGMRLRPPGQTLDARKSWFMFDNEIVALGAGISATDGKAVETIVENRKLNDTGNNTLTVNGTTRSTALGWTESMTGVNWAHLQGNVAGADIGYVFPGSAAVQGLRESRTAKWSDINTYSGFGNTTSKTRNYLTMSVEHGVDPTNGAYSYVVLPGSSPTQVATYASSPPITVLSNTSDAQAVSKPSLGITAAQFWRVGSTTAGPITSDAIASVIVRETVDEIAVSVADPTHAHTGSIAVAVALSAACVVESDPTITVTQTNPGVQLSVNVAGSEGLSHTVALRKSGSCVGAGQSVHTFEVENLPLASSGDPLTVYSTDAQASGGKWRRYDSNAVGDFIEHAVDVPSVGTYRVLVKSKNASDRGIAQVAIQGTDAGVPVDFFAASSGSFVSTNVGTVSFAHAGPMTIRITVTGKNAASTGYRIPLDSIVLERIGGLPAGAVHETEALRATSSSGDTVSIVNDSGASGGKLTKLTANAVGDYVDFAMPVVAPGTYDIQVRVKKYSDRGRFQLYINGHTQGLEQDLYATSQAFTTLELGAVDITASGTVTLRFQVTGTSGTKHDLALDSVELIAR